jgi:transposase-like protein
MEPSERTRPAAQAVPLEVVRDDDSPLEVKVGRKRKLTPAVFERIMAAIEEGSRVTPACREHGISPKTLFMRVARNQEESKRFAEAKRLRLQKWHEEWLGEMHEHAKRSPWATAWLLERNFPEFYALREFSRAPAEGSGQPIGG